MVGEFGTKLYHNIELGKHWVYINTSLTYYLLPLFSNPRPGVKMAAEFPTCIRFI